MVPVPAAVQFVPRVVAIRLMMVPPAIGMEGQADTREMNAGRRVEFRGSTNNLWRKVATFTTVK